MQNGVMQFDDIVCCEQTHLANNGEQLVFPTTVVAGHKTRFAIARQGPIVRGDML